jgi:hypothetical protein
MKLRPRRNHTPAFKRSSSTCTGGVADSLDEGKAAFRAAGDA